MYEDQNHYGYTDLRFLPVLCLFPESLKELIKIPFEKNKFIENLSPESSEFLHIANEGS